MWGRLMRLHRGMRYSLPADHWVHTDGREVRRERVGDHPRDPWRWVLVTPLTEEQAMDLVRDEDDEPRPPAAPDGDALVL